MSRVDVVGLARQTTGMGTLEDTMEYFVPVETATPENSQETLTMEETIGTRFPTGLEYGTRYFTIPMVGAPRPASLPRILSGYVGQPSSAAGGPPGTHKHTQDPTAATKVPEPHSIFVVRNDPSPAIVDLFWDAKGSELALDAAPNDFLRMSASWIAIDLDDSQTAPTATSDLTKRWKFSEVTVEFSEDDGATWTPKLSAAWGITYNNNLDVDNAVLGSRKLYGLPPGNADCEVRFSPREDLNENYRRYLEADPVTCALRMTAVSASAKLVVTVFAFETTDAPAPVSGADILKVVETTGRAKLAEAGANAGKFVLFETFNDVATYA